MTWSNTARLTIVLMLCSASGTRAQAPAQTPENPPPEATATQPPESSPSPAPAPAPLPKPQFFGGTVTALDAQHISVSRSSPGKAPEHRTFLINAKTKMTKSVKVKSRVTVRYRHMPEGDIALEIQIRPLMRFPRAS
ncbi:MAG TPA: hypothetical protein VHU83_13180 [Bryobacteraceae bacterium]|jgi:hypothetical protein|nr:hypothetical protein [Bryobacteraceae bacterium]